MYGNMQNAALSSTVGAEIARLEAELVRLKNLRDYYFHSRYYQGDLSEISNNQMQHYSGPHNLLP